MAINVDQALCDGCSTCVDTCPTGAIIVEDEKAQGTEDCVDCGLCVEECPTGAISLAA